MFLTEEFESEDSGSGSESDGYADEKGEHMHATIACRSVLFIDFPSLQDQNRSLLNCTF